MMLAAGVVGLTVLMGPGCGSGPETSSSQGGAAPGCGDNEVPDGKGGCVRPGVPPSGCAAGFTPKDFGCDPILPDDACPEGTLAVPGDTACHEVMPCPSGTYPDPMGTGEAVYVDPQSPCAAGMTDCGTKAKPWTTIQGAVDHAPDGAQILIAAGHYAEDVLIAKPLSLVGACPRKVEITGQSSTGAAVRLGSGAAGSSLRGLAMQGPDVGVWIDHAADVTIEQVWVHDTGAFGVFADQGATGLSIQGTLIERASEVGLTLDGAEAVVESSAVRDTRPVADTSGVFGVGIWSAHSVKASQPDLTLRGSIVERNVTGGVASFGGALHVDSSVIQGTRSDPVQHQFGQGVFLDLDKWGEPVQAQILGSVIRDNQLAGISAVSASLSVENTVLATNKAMDAGSGGIGLSIGHVNVTQPLATLSMRGCLVQGNQMSGLSIQGASGQVETTRIVDTAPEQPSHEQGIGISVGSLQGEPVVCEIRSCWLEGNSDVGVAIHDATAIVEHTTVRKTLPQASDGQYGDGVTIVSDHGAASLRLTDCRIESSARAGLSIFGATAILSGNTFRCNQIDIAAMPFSGFTADPEQVGQENLCPALNDVDCTAATAECHASTGALAVPNIGP
jgi:hypothetical protein